MSGPKINSSRNKNKSLLAFMKNLAMILFVFNTHITVNASLCENTFKKIAYLAELKENLVINSSNPEKYNYFLSKLLNDKQSVSILKQDIHEIEADPISVAVHKASQFRDLEKIVITEDTALHVEGEKIGINVRWYADRIHEYIGKKAVWQSTVSFLYQNKVYVFSTSIPGKIVEPDNNFNDYRGKGFTHYFRPKGASATFNNVRHIVKHNPRIQNVLKILRGDFILREPLFEWEGPWQKED